MTVQEPPTPAATDAGSVEVLSGDRLRAVLDTLPDYVAAQVTSVVLVHLPPGTLENDAPSAWWSTSVCENSHVVTYIGHEDPVAMTSVLDGSVTTSIAC
jgi:hypothetical protein